MAKIAFPNNLTLQAKLMLCLLVTSLASTALVGGFAYWRLMQKFDDMVLHESARRFTADVSDYFRAYGSWEEGQKRERFRAFTDRRNSLLGRPPKRLGELMPPSAGPALPGLTPDSLVMEPISSGQQRARPSRLHRPPFRFYLFDKDFRSLVTLAPYQVGDKVRADHTDNLLPIESDGRIVAHFVPEGNVSYSDLDLGYLAAMREALIAGAVAGLVLSLVLGIVLSRRLSRALRHLTHAVRAMRQGELKQYVDNDSSDEIGMLTRSFNGMSEQLSRQYQELEESKLRIEKLAIQLREQSIRDGLTQLHNRRYFDEQAVRLFQHAMRYGRPFSIMLADIDHFKKINDTYSHAMGDEVLRRIGEILSTKVRGSDLVARYGGEEFVIAFPETEHAHAHETCEAIRKRIEAYPWSELHPDLKVTMSIGLSSDAKAGDIYAMLDEADSLLYRAKRGGRNQVCSRGDSSPPEPSARLAANGG